MDSARKLHFDQMINAAGSGETNTIFELPEGLIDTVSGADSFTQGGNFAQNFACFAQNIGGFSQGKPPPHSAY